MYRIYKIPVNWRWGSSSSSLQAMEADRRDEQAGLLDVFQSLYLAEETTLGSGRDLLLRIVSMLTRMAKPR